MDGYRPMVISVALTGAVPSRADHPRLPVTPEQIAEDAAACAAAGASVVHVHVRDEAGAPTHRRDLYEQAIGAIRQRAPELAVCVTTSSRVDGSLAARMTGLALEGELRPDLASLTLGSFNFPTTVSANPPDEIRALLEHMAERSIRPEFEVFELGMVNTLHALIDQGLVGERPVVNILLGSLGSAPAFVGDLARIVERLPEGSEWAAAGIGLYQRPMTIAAAVMDGNVRTGMEDHPAGDRPGWANPDAVRLAVAAAGWPADRWPARPRPGSVSAFVPYHLGRRPSRFADPRTVARWVIYACRTAYAAEVAEIVWRTGGQVVALVDNLPDGSTVAGDDLPDVEVILPAGLHDRLLALGCVVPQLTPGHRHTVAAEARRAGFTDFPPLIDPSAVVARTAELGEGTVVNAGAVVAAGARLGRFVHLNRSASVGHHNHIGDFASLGPGCVLAGQVTVGRGAFLGAGAVCAPQVTVGANALVGAGAVVVRPVPDGAVVVGNPATVLRADGGGYGGVTVPG
jgi:sugar O-acyltransferase (sialic acid O-acetyltransferase NeuD family)